MYRDDWWSMPTNLPEIPVEGDLLHAVSGNLKLPRSVEVDCVNKDQLGGECVLVHGLVQEPITSLPDEVSYWHPRLGWVSSEGNPSYAHVVVVGGELYKRFLRSGFVPFEEHAEIDSGIVIW